MARSEGFTIVAGPEFKTVEAQLREVDATFPGKLRAALKEAAEPILSEVRTAAQALPSHGSKHTGLRGRLAAGADVRLSDSGGGARARFIAQMDDPTEAGLPRGMDSGARGWRHPVFGNTNNWVTQRGGSWFREVIADNGPEIEDKLTDVLEEAADAVARAGHA